MMIKNLAAQLMLTALGAASLLGDGPTLNVSDQQFAVSMMIPVEENLSDVEEYWSTIPECLESLKSVSGAEREGLRAILSIGFPVEVDLRYEGRRYALFFPLLDQRRKDC
jgi:hypothetical protein